MLTRIAATSALLSLAGCGSLVDSDYRGEVLFELSGTVVYSGDAIFDNIGVALAWSNQDSADTAILPVVVKTQFPAQYTLQIFSPPPENAEVQLFGNTDSRVSVGKIYLFEDDDNDGIWDLPQERLVGSTFDSAVVWVDAGVETNSVAPLPFFSLSSGFHFVNIPYVSCSPEGLPDLLPLEPDQADLYIGYTSSFDYDCDGNFDVPTADDAFFECPPEEAVMRDCDEFRQFLHEDLDLLTEQFSYMDPEYMECLDMICGDVMEDVAGAADSNTGPTQPHGL